MATTLRDVAKLAGVSFRTVSNVVNGYAPVSDSTRAKVEAAIEELGYQPNHMARTLRLGRSNMLGLAVPRLAEGYFAELASEIIDVARERGYVVLTEQTGNTRALELDALRGARRQLTDGLIIAPVVLSSEDVEQFETERPVVVLGENVFSPRLDHVTMRNVAAARAATEHLLQLGHRRIAAIGSTEPGAPSVGTAVLRLQGYREALHGHGLEVDEALVRRVGQWGREDGARAVRELLDGSVDFSAVFAVTDMLAMGAAHELEASGLRVPEDVSVIGFDDLTEGQYTAPPLTTVDAGRRSIAEVAVTRLVDRIERPGGPPLFYEADFRIVERQSTARRRDA